MLREYLRVLKHVAVFGLGTLSTSLTGFLLIPVYTRILAPAEYGNLELILSTITISVGVVSLQLHVGLFERYFAHGDQVSRQRVVSTAMLFLIPFAGLSALLLMSFAPQISFLLFQDRSAVLLLEIASGIVFFRAISALPLALLRAQEHSLLYSAFAVGQFLLTIGLILTFVLIASWGVLGILLGQFLGAAVIMLLLSAVLVRDWQWLFSSKDLRLLLRFSLPLVFVSCGTFILDLSDRYFLNYFAGPAVVGTYSLAYKVASLLTVFLVGPFQLAWPIVMFSVQREPYAERFYSRMLTYVVAVGSYSVLAITLIAPYLIKALATPSYYGALALVPVLSSAYLMALCYPVIAVGIGLSAKTEHHAYAIIGASVINLILNWLLIAPLGMLGAAISTIVCYTLMSVYIYFPAQRLYRISYEWSRILKVVGLSYALIGGVEILALFQSQYDLVARILILLGFPALLLALGFFKSTEIETIRDILFKRLSIKNLLPKHGAN